MKRIVVAGAGGFIGGALVKYLAESNVGPDICSIVAVDKKPIPDWYQVHPHVTNLCLDLSDPVNCKLACCTADEVYNFACDMGGMGFIESNRVACMRSVLINTHLIEAAYNAGVDRYFYSSSACAYNVDLQRDKEVRALKESDAYPANAERGYGWEKLFSEIVCQEYWAERGFKTFIARFHNVYGPNGTWTGGREKAPAAMCRKVIEAKEEDKVPIEIWGDGTQQRSFMYIDDCVKGIDKIMHCDKLIAEPINLGSSELVTINNLLDMAVECGGGLAHSTYRRYNMDAPLGVAGRNSDNTMIQDVLGWQPDTPLTEGMAKTYDWIEEQYNARKAGQRVNE